MKTLPVTINTYSALCDWVLSTVTSLNESGYTDGGFYSYILQARAETITGLKYAGGCFVECIYAGVAVITVLFYGSSNTAVYRMFYSRDSNEWSAIHEISDYRFYRSYQLKDYITSNYSTNMSGLISVSGNNVHIEAGIGQFPISTTEVLLGTLTKFKPSGSDYITLGTDGALTSLGNIVKVRINTSGQIYVVGESSTTATLRFNLIYNTTDANIYY